MQQFCLLACLLSFSLSALGQTGNIRESWMSETERYQTYVQEGQLRQAREILLARYQEEPSDSIAEQLGELSFRLRDYQEAIVHYQVAIDNRNFTRVSLLRYAQSLAMDGDFRKAKSHFFAYQDSLEIAGVEFEPMDRNLTEESFYVDSTSFTIYSVEIDSNYNQMAPMRWGDQLLFLSDQPTNAMNRPRDPTTGRDFYDFFIADFNYQYLESVPEPFSALNTPLHEGAASLMGEDTIVITSTSKAWFGGQPRTLQLYMAVRKRGNKWQIKKLPFVEKEYNYAFPSWDARRQRLLFASDQPGGKGGYDLYFSWFIGGSWTEPLWMGPLVNTELNDVYPHAGVDGSLMFSSEGLLGLGGMDVYQALQDTIGLPTYIQNMGYPINSPGDDFGIQMQADTTSGYVTSNRLNGKNDRLMFYEVHPIILRGVVRDQSNDRGLPDALVTIREINSPDREILTGPDGTYATKVYPGKLYYIDASHPDHKPDLLFLSTEDNADYSDMEAEQVLERKTKLFILGTVKDAETFSSVTEARLEIINKTTGEVFIAEGNEKGRFELELDAENNYLFIASKDGKTGYEEFVVPELGESSYTYYVNIFMEQFRMYQMKGTVVDAIKGAPIPHAQIELVNQSTGKRELIFANQQGNYSFQLNSFFSYILLAQSGLQMSLQYIDTYDLSTERNLDIYMY